MPPSARPTILYTFKEAGSKLRFPWIGKRSSLLLTILTRSLTCNFFGGILISSNFSIFSSCIFVNASLISAINCLLCSGDANRVPKKETYLENIPFFWTHMFHDLLTWWKYKIQFFRFSMDNVLITLLNINRASCTYLSTNPLLFLVTATWNVPPCSVIIQSYWL